MTHDQERQYHEREHAGYMSEQRGYGSKADLDAILQAKAERVRKLQAEWRPAFLGFKVEKADRPKVKD